MPLTWLALHFIGLNELVHTSVVTKSFAAKVYLLYNHTVMHLSFLCIGDNPPCAEEQLTVPKNGSVSCVQTDDALKCTLTCQDKFVFGSSVDISPQYCRDGIWDYRREEIDIPDCQREHTPSYIFIVPLPLLSLLDYSLLIDIAL